MKTKNLTKIPPPPYYYFYPAKYILQFEFVKYKTHKGYRTHELTCVVSSCVLCPLCVLYFFAKNVGNNIKREEIYLCEACTCETALVILYPWLMAGGGGGGHSRYILVGVCRSTSKKGGLRHGHNPKKGGS